MAKNKGARVIVTLECTCDTRSIDKLPVVFRYTTTKNRRNTTAKLELRKHCPSCNKHSTFREIK